MSSSLASCIFCKIIKGDLPAFKLYESASVLAFMDIQPLSTGHALIIPKHHGSKLTDIPDESLAEILPLAKRIAAAQGVPDYNVLQNNGRAAHQLVDHVHFHVIPKPNETEGLGISWPMQKQDLDKLKTVFEGMKPKM